MAIVLGGVVTAALGYLLMERINRANTALALAIGPPRRPAGQPPRRPRRRGASPSSRGRNAATSSWPPLRRLPGRGCRSASADEARREARSQSGPGGGAKAPASALHPTVDVIGRRKRGRNDRQPRLSAPASGRRVGHSRDWRQRTRGRSSLSLSQQALEREGEHLAPLVLVEPFHERPLDGRPERLHGDR